MPEFCRCKYCNDSGIFRCLVCGSFNGLYGGFCHKKQCKRIAKKNKICTGNNGIHMIDKWYLGLSRYNRKLFGICTECRISLSKLSNYKQDSHIELYKLKNGFISDLKITQLPKFGRVIISGSIRHFILSKSGYRCIECGATKDETTLHIDHIKPISKGGSNELDNLQVLCRKCNLSKHTDEWVGGK